MAAVRAAQLGPKDALTRDTIGVVFTRLGDHDAAVALFEDAVTSTPDHAEYQYNLASSRQFAGNFDGAKQAYRRAIALDPGLYKAWSALISLEKQTVENEQIDTLSRINSEEPENSQINTQANIPSMESKLASNPNTQANPLPTQPTTNENSEDTATTLPSSLPDGSASQNELSDIVLDSPERGELASNNKVTPSPNQPTGSENPSESR